MLLTFRCCVCSSDVFGISYSTKGFTIFVSVLFGTSLFFISAVKSYWSIPSCLILLISWKFSNKDKNAKVCHGEYQYVSMPTLKIFEFDPAFLAFIRSCILRITCTSDIFCCCIGSSVRTRHNIQCLQHVIICVVGFCLVVDLEQGGSITNGDTISSLSLQGVFFL